MPQRKQLKLIDDIDSNVNVSGWYKKYSNHSEIRVVEARILELFTKKCGIELEIN